MRNQISYKLAIGRLYMHGYETSRYVLNAVCVHHYNATTPDEQDRLGKIVLEQGQIVDKYERKLIPVLHALARSERHMSRPQRRELNLLRSRCCESLLNKIKEKTKINFDNDFDLLGNLAIDTFDDLDLPMDDFDPIEDYYESQADYSEDNPQDYGN